MSGALPAVERIKRELRIRPDEHRRIRELELYAELLGEDALVRQVESGKLRHVCCWEPIGGAHHPVCPNASI
jgi:hypothetical protein